MPDTTTIHRDHRLPIWQHVRVPSPEQIDDLPARRKTRAVTRRERQRKARPEIQDYQGISDSSSDMEYYVTHPAKWREFVPRVTTKSVIDTEIDPGTELDNDSESNKDYEPEPVNENTSDLEEDDNELEQEPELEPEGEMNEECERGTTLEETSETGLESDQDENQNRKVEIRPEPRLRPKRTAKLTIRLTYVEPGRSRDQPLTIVHRGIVIKTGKHYIRLSCYILITP